MIRKAVLLLLVVAGLLFLGRMLHAQQVDAGIFHPSDSTLEIRIKPAATVAGFPFSNIVFTIRWRSSYGVSLGAPFSPTYAVSKQNGEQVSGSYHYQKFAAATAQTVSWPANTEVTVLSIPVMQTGQGMGTFELVNDAWTAANNGSYYAEIGGEDRTGNIYQASVNGVPLPIVVSALRGWTTKDSVYLQWQLRDIGSVIGFMVQRQSPDGNWRMVRMVPVDETNSEGWYSCTDPFPQSTPSSTVLSYRLQILNGDGSVGYSPVVEIRQDAIPPSRFHCEVYPNPATDAVILAFVLPADDVVSLTLVDMLGRRVRAFLVHEHLPAGSHVRSLGLLGITTGSHFLILSGRSRSSAVPIFLMGNR